MLFEWKELKNRMADLRRGWDNFLGVAAGFTAGTWLVFWFRRRRGDETWIPVPVPTLPAERRLREPWPMLAVEPAPALARLVAGSCPVLPSAIPSRRATPPAPALRSAFRTVPVRRNQTPSEPAPARAEEAVSFTPEVPPEVCGQGRLPQAPEAPRPAAVAIVMEKQKPFPQRALYSPRVIDYVRHYAAGLLNPLVAPFRKPQVRLSTAALLLAALLWNSPAARGRLGSALDLIGQPIHERAAFNWQDRFDGDSPAWVEASAISRETSGAIRVHGMALHPRTRDLHNFVVNFAARAEHRSIGWIVGAADPANHAVFKLIDRGRSGDGTRFELARYMVVKGDPVGEPKTFPVVVAGPKEGFLEISIRVSDEQISTLVNDFGVDSWKRPPALQAGGLALLAEEGDSFQVRSLTVSGNDDALGLFLWGAEETLKSVHRNLGSLAASLHSTGMVIQNRT